jgi:hypothetical protein
LSPVRTFKSYTSPLLAILFRFRVANIDQIFKLQKKLNSSAAFFLLLELNHFFFILLQSKFLTIFQENDANIRVEEWNPDDPSGDEFACFPFWGAD